MSNTFTAGPYLSGLPLATSITLNDAQIKALPTTPQALLSAPGSSQLYLPIVGICRTQSIWAADYTNIDADARLIISYGTSQEALLPIVENVGSAVTSFLAGGGPDGTIATMPGYFIGAGEYSQASFSGITGTYFSDVAGKALNLRASNGSSGAFTGGNAANRLIITVYYYVVDL